jgi:hypothetical protein
MTTTAMVSAAVPRPPCAGKSPSTSAAPGGISEGMRTLQEAQKKLDESLARVEAHIKDAETAYLEDTVHGNIIRGWEGFADLRGKKDSLMKKIRPYTENEKLFSNSSVPPPKKYLPKTDSDDAADATDFATRRKKDKESKVGKPSSIGNKNAVIKLKLKKRKHKALDAGSDIDEPL